MDYLTFALAKGRLADKAMKLLNSIGITCSEMDEDNRKLIFENKELKYRFFLAKASDVPTYVEYGVADIGVVGYDVLLEENRPLYELLDLKFGKCKMVVAGRDNALDILENSMDIRVATKYSNITNDYFYKTKNKNIEIVKLNGSVELGAVIGLSDVIVDIVETGSTLKANGLKVLEEICDVSAKLVANNVSMKTKHERIKEIITKLNAL